jgi:hypothetical protein
MKRSLWIAAIVAGSALASTGTSAQRASAVADPNSSVRIVNGQQYRVLRVEPLVLYARERQVIEGKRFTTVVDRFFSTTPTAAVQPLTLEALKRAYPDNHKFHDMLTLAFRSDAELVRYDDHHNEYLVARLLRQTLSAATVLGSTR